MRIDVLTLFPEVMLPYLSASILGRAHAAGSVEFHLHQLRDFSTDPHRKVDDRPFGGGPGMVLACQPVLDAVAAIENLDSRPALRVLTTPQGRRFSQGLARELAATERLLIICGHYEGYDERIVELLQPVEISLGDFVMTGGEICGLAIIDSVVRLLPGVLGCEASPHDESFSQNELEYPQYTRPQEFRGLRVPDVLLSGHHAEIERWRRQMARERTQRRRPDLLPGADAARSYECAPATAGGEAPGDARHAFARFARPTGRARRCETRMAALTMQAGASASSLR